MKASIEIAPQRRQAETEQARLFLQDCRAHVDARLNRIVPVADLQPTTIHEAMRWSLFAGGKRLRPALMIAAGQTFGAPLELLLDTACAFEMLHTYSLIHDDLPAMDDDDLRRGRPTCHVKFDEATAILAGDALHALAFQTIADDEKLTHALRLRLIQELAHAAGTPDGMVAGQARDLAAHAASITAEDLDLMHRAKTGALIRASARCGALVAGAKEHELQSISDYAAALGLLFQITDDLLDNTATADDLGKTPGKDARSDKATYTSLYGDARARELAHQVYTEASNALDRLLQPTDLLRTIAQLILERHS